MSAFMEIAWLVFVVRGNKRHLSIKIHIWNQRTIPCPSEAPKGGGGFVRGNGSSSEIHHQNFDISIFSGINSLCQRHHRQWQQKSTKNFHLR